MQFYRYLLSMVLVSIAANFAAEEGNVSCFLSISPNGKGRGIEIKGKWLRILAKKESGSQRTIILRDDNYIFDTLRWSADGRYATTLWDDAREPTDMINLMVVINVHTTALRHRWYDFECPRPPLRRVRDAVWMHSANKLICAEPNEAEQTDEVAIFSIADAVSPLRTDMPYWLLGQGAICVYLIQPSIVFTSKGRISNLAVSADDKAVFCDVTENGSTETISIELD